jgi:hypothetical protein
MFDMQVTGMDFFGDWGADFQDTVEKSMDQLCKQMANFLKNQIQREISDRSAGDSVMVGHSQTQTIQELEPSTIAFKESRDSQDEPSKPLVFTGTMYSSVEVKQIGDAEYKAGIFSKKTTNGLAVKDYGIIQEKGYPANNIPPRPFVAPSLFGNAERIKGRLESLTGVPVKIVRV